MFLQGTSPNDYPEKITVQPGETYMGYSNYHKMYAREGLKIGPSPTAGQVREKAAKVSAEAATILKEAEEQKLAALEAKRQAEAARAEADLAIAEANSARATAAMGEQRDDDDPPELGLDQGILGTTLDLTPVVVDEDAELAPDPKIEKAKAAKAKRDAKKARGGK